MQKVCILDYGSGNVQSVYNLFTAITNDVRISNEEIDIAEATHLVFPGVGAFGTTMEKVRKTLPLAMLEKAVKIEKKPFLGICVGMQVLATRGFEFGEHEGLDWISGEVHQLNAQTLPLPHVGWNDISRQKSDPLLIGLEKHNDFYYVHKYAFKPQDQEAIIATSNYGSDFCCIIRKDNIVGVQFHPEKSQQAGKKIAINFLACS